MRRFWLLLAVLALVLVAVAPAGAAPARPDHSVTGVGEVPGGLFANDVRMVISARSFGAIDNARGKVHLRGYTGLEDYRFRVDVDCLRVDPTTGKAWIGGELDRSNLTQSWVVGHGVLIIVDDNPGGTDQLAGLIGNPAGGPWPEEDWGFTVCETDVFSPTPPDFAWGGVRVR